MGKAIQTSLHGRMAGLTRSQELMGRGGLVSGGDDRPSINMPHADTVSLVDDFLGDLLADEWAYVHGDTGAVSTGALVTGSGGVLRLQMQAVTPLNVSGENVALTQGLFKNWKANMGKAGAEQRLSLYARVKLQNVSRTIDRMHVFVGFSDSGGAEFPAYDTGAGVIANATDAIGLAYSPGGDTGWHIVGVRAGTVVLGVPAVAKSPTANVYDDLEIDMRTPAGSAVTRASAFLNGALIAAAANVITNTVALSPWIGHWEQDTGGKYLDIDLVAISGTRDTGI